VWRARRRFRGRRGSWGGCWANGVRMLVREWKKREKT